MTDDASSAHQSFSLAHYRQLADLRFYIRNYLQFSEQIARSHGLEPQQHQLMLTIKGLPADTIPTVSALASRLCLKHHSTVELINRLVERGSAIRKPSLQDRRQVLVELTPKGEELLETLSHLHLQELHTCAPELLSQLSTLLKTAVPENGISARTSNQSSHVSETDASGTKNQEAASAEAG